MNQTLSYLPEIFGEIAERDIYFNKALSIVKQNCKGRIWLIGSGVYKPLIKFVHKKHLSKPKDLDFLVEYRERYEDIVMPKGYKISHSRFGGIKFQGRINIDMVDIEHFWPSAVEFVEPTLNNFLIHAPLNIQSIAYDVFEKKVIGEEGIEAIMKKEIKINNEGALDFCSRMLGKHPHQIIKEKAKELGFSYLLD